MSGVRVDSIGFGEVMGALSEFAEIPGDVAKQALTAGAEPMRAEMESRAPVRTGKLKGSIRVGTRIIRKRSIEVGAFGDDGRHAHLVENGHGGPKPAPPHPFIWPSYEATKEDAYNAIAEEVRRWLGG